MQLSVHYSTHGRIVSLVRSAATDTPDVSGSPSPSISVEPAAGERVALVDLDSSWDQRTLAEIHQTSTVVDGANGPYLHSRDATT